MPRNGSGTYTWNMLPEWTLRETIKVALEGELYRQLFLDATEMYRKDFVEASLRYMSKDNALLRQLMRNQK